MVGEPDRDLAVAAGRQLQVRGQAGQLGLAASASLAASSSGVSSSKVRSWVDCGSPTATTTASSSSCPASSMIMAVTKCLPWPAPAGTWIDQVPGGEAVAGQVIVQRS